MPGTNLHAHRDRRGRSISIGYFANRNDGVRRATSEASAARTRRAAKTAADAAMPARKLFPTVLAAALDVDVVELFRPTGDELRRLTRQELQRARDAVATLGVILGRRETPKRRRR